MRYTDILEKENLEVWYVVQFREGKDGDAKVIAGPYDNSSGAKSVATSFAKKDADSRKFYTQAGPIFYYGVKSYELSEKEFLIRTDTGKWQTSSQSK